MNRNKNNILAVGYRQVACTGEPKSSTNVAFCFTFPQSSPARNFYQRSGHRPPRSVAGPAACARPAGWTHLGACSRWVSTVPCPCCRPSRTATNSYRKCSGSMFLTGDEDGSTSDNRRNLYYFKTLHLLRYLAAVEVTVTTTTTAATTTTTHALRTITSHTVRWTINVTTGSSRSKTYGRKRSFVRIRMIVRVRARICACVCWLSMFGRVCVGWVCLAVCVC